MAWYDKPVTNPFNPPVEPGIDLGTRVGEPITALGSGSVKDAFYGPFGGVVGVSTFLPGLAKPAEEYYLHLDQITVRPGDQVSVGQPVGLAGGQLAGGSHPAQPAYSTGPHTEFGAYLGDLFKSPTLDPTGLVQAARAGQLQGGGGVGSFGLPDPSALLAGAFAGLGKGLANALAAGLNDVATFFKRQIIALAVAVVVAIVLFA